jgi:predicted aconitase with swiveling domain
VFKTSMPCRPATAVVLCALLSWGPSPARPQEPRPDPELEAGVRQVAEGDFETAVLTLEAVRRRFVREGASAALRVRAALHLAVAHVALDQRDAAKARFRDALALEPSLRLTPDRHSPKVIGVFEEARREHEAQARAATASRAAGKSRLPWLIGGAAVVGGGAYLVTRGGGESGPITLSGARFGTPVLNCPDGDTSTPLGVAILVEARNDGKQPAALTSVTAQLVIVTSALPGEIGFASSRPATALPASLPAGRAVTVRVDTTLLCQNGAGDASRFNEWSGRLTLATAAGAVNVETADRMVVNIP